MRCHLSTLLGCVMYTWTFSDVVWGRYRPRCAKAIFNYNGVEILLGESLLGKIVVLYLMKHKCERLCFSQLQGLNNLGSFYNAAGHPVRIVAIKPRNSPSIAHFKP